MWSFASWGMILQCFKMFDCAQNGVLFFLRVCVCRVCALCCRLRVPGGGELSLFVCPGTGNWPPSYKIKKFPGECSGWEGGGGGDCNKWNCLELSPSCNIFYAKLTPNISQMYAQITPAWSSSFSLVFVLYSTEHRKEILRTTSSSLKCH